MEICLYYGFGIGLFVGILLHAGVSAIDRRFHNE